MSHPKRTFLLLLLGACLAVAGCGSDDEGDPIPQDSAVLLQGQLDNIQARLANGSAGACDDILSGPRGPNVDAVNQSIASLPDGVDQDVRSALQDGFDKLFSLVDERCNELRQDAESQETDTTEEPPVVTETETVTAGDRDGAAARDGDPAATGDRDNTAAHRGAAPADEGDGGGGVLAPPEDEG